VDRAAVPLVWLPALVMWLRSLRRGARWPLVAPTLFVAGLGVVLFGAALAEPAGVTKLLGAVWPGRGTTAPAVVRAAVVEAGEQLGVVGAAARRSGRGAAGGARAARGGVHALAGGGGRFARGRGAGGGGRGGAAGGGRRPPGRQDRPARGGRGGGGDHRGVAPLLDGGPARWTRDAHLPARLLDRALADVPLRADVNPGSPEMTALFRYGHALGVRPDVTFRGAR
jgi:hypothetical protein